MSYQTTEHVIGTTQNLELILGNIDNDAKSFTDIGCNQGVISCAVALHGIPAHGLEQQAQFINYGKKKAELDNINNVRFTEEVIDFDNLEHIKGSDVIALLSVHHQMVKHLGLDNGNKLLIEIFKSANKQFFFQPATIYEKYGQAMPWAENDLQEIEAYFQNLFKGIREFDFHNLGLVDNRLPKSEPNRPLYLFNFKNSSNKKIHIAKSPLELNNQSGQIVRVPIEKCRGHYWQSFANDGWHFMREQVKQLKQLNQSKEEIQVDETILFKYGQIFTPNTFAEAADILSIPKDDFGILGNQSTRHYQSIELLNPNITEKVRSAEIQQASRAMQEDDIYHTGPLTKELAMREINRITKIYQSIYQTGYNPDLHLDGYIRGHFVTKGNDWIFLVTAGSHRLATIAEMPYTWVKVRLQPNRPAVLNLDNLSELITVKNGALLESEIRAFYEPYFTENGNQFKKIIKFSQ